MPVVALYQSALAAVNEKSKPGFVSLEGYLAGRLVVETIRRIPGEPTREAFLDAIEREPFDLGGIEIHVQRIRKIRVTHQVLFAQCFNQRVFVADLKLPLIAAP